MTTKKGILPATLCALALLAAACASNGKMAAKPGLDGASAETAAELNVLNNRGNAYYASGD